MKKVIILGICAMPFFFASCGGAESNADGTDQDSVNVEEEVIMISSEVNTETSAIRWNNYDGTDVDHEGTVRVLNGSMDVTSTNGVAEITAGSLVIDMNTISEGSEKLENHLKDSTFFDVNNFATTEFAFDRHENGMVYGTATIVGKEVAIEAPVEVSIGLKDVVVEVGEFKIDFSQLEMPFFMSEVDAPAEERHDPVIGFTASIIGSK